jgi:hypothetical protein
MEDSKLIKAYTSGRYRVELHEEGQGYKVKYEAKRHGEVQSSETIKDYNTASFLFDLKIDEFEGN